LFFAGEHGFSARRRRFFAILKPNGRRLIFICRNIHAYPYRDISYRAIISPPPGGYFGRIKVGARANFSRRGRYGAEDRKIADISVNDNYVNNDLNRYRLEKQVDIGLKSRFGISAGAHILCFLFRRMTELWLVPSASAAL
jgi:hypothetical protein